MTTNKPEVVLDEFYNAEFPRHERTSCSDEDPSNASPDGFGCKRCNAIIHVRAERLQAECEQLHEHLQNMIDQTTPLEPVPGDPKWSRRIQLDGVIEERDSLRVEREQLRKDVERYQSILSAVLREIPHRRGVGGNAPGHGHTVPGIWDEDNGALAGKECAWCKIWNEAISAIQGGG